MYINTQACFRPGPAGSATASNSEQLIKALLPGFQMTRYKIDNHQYELI
jgi:hypothetical protein